MVYERIVYHITFISSAPDCILQLVLMQRYA